MNYIWPIALVVVSNTVYHICAKSVPSSINPFATLSVTYLVGAVCSLLFYYIFEKSPNIVTECGKLNWSPFVLGLVIVGLEAGYVYAYRAGWTVSTASVVQSSILAVSLILVGFLVFKEAITFNKILGLVICLIGLFFINK